MVTGWTSEGIKTVIEGPSTSQYWAEYTVGRPWADIRQIGENPNSGEYKHA